MAKKTGHSSIGASNSHRWLECPGSVALEAKFPNKGSPYALEGTGAHRLGEKCLLSGADPRAFVGKDLLMEDGTPVRVTEEMADAVKIYTDFIRANLLELSGSTIEVEKKLHLSWVHPMLYGTADAVIAQPFGKLLVVDYKHGVGVQVEAEGNPQALYYALGALGPEDCSGVEQFEEIEMVIVQPRAQGEAIRRARISPAELREWGENVLGPGAKKALGKNQPLKAGEHCRFCRAAGSCPEQMRQAMTVAGETFQPTEISSGSLPDVTLLGTNELGRILGLIPRFEQWVADVRNRVLQELASNHEVPGWKLVRGRANRKWKDEKRAADTLRLELGDEAFTTPSLKSPAQIEAAAKKAGLNLDLGHLTEKPEGKPTLAPESDARAPIEVSRPEDVFKDETNEQES